MTMFMHEAGSGGPRWGPGGGNGTLGPAGGSLEYELACALADVSSLRRALQNEQENYEGLRVSSRRSEQLLEEKLAGLREENTRLRAELRRVAPRLAAALEAR